LLTMAMSWARRGPDDEPSVIHLYPYKLGDLNCKAIATRTANSVHGKH